jgi:hypothetical protein
VTTLGGYSRPGDVGQAGATDGIGKAARVNNVWGLALDPGGNLFIADGGENRIIKATPLLLFDPTATSFATSGALFQFRITGPPGSNAVVEQSTDFQNWSPIQTNSLPPTGLNGSVQGASSGFFRARLAP